MKLNETHVRFLALLWVILYGTSPLNAQTSITRQPNIIFIMSDDHACKAISSYDSTLCMTPQIDRLSKNGIRFTNCFCTNAVCGPSRACILTGNLTHINGMINNDVIFDSSQVTLPKILKTAGYQTAIVGKWHLKSTPSGFDFWKILPGQGEYYNPDFITNGIQKRETGYVTNLIASSAMEWMEHRDQSKPFFLMINNKAPHKPWLPEMKYAMLYDTANIPVPENFFDNYSNRASAAASQQMMIARDLIYTTDLKMGEKVNDDNNAQINFGRLSLEEQKQWDSIYAKRNSTLLNQKSEQQIATFKYKRFISDYLATIKSVDDNIGFILDYLERNQLMDNTIIVYTSNQGYFLGEHGWFDKRFMYEEAYRMPLIMQLPSKKFAGTTNDQMIMNIDFAPTLLQLAGVSNPAKMQGKSFADFLNNSDTLRKATYYHYFEFPGEHSVKRHYGVRTDRYKLIHYYFNINEWELFDLKNDPHEMKNLYNDTAYAIIVNELKKSLNQMRINYKDTALTLPKNFVKTENKLLHSAYMLYNKPSEKYPDINNRMLTDGLIENSAFLSAALSKNWIGFEKNDFEMQITKKDTVSITEVAIRFLDAEQMWIFKPDSVVFTFKLSDGKTKSDLRVNIKEEKRKTGGSVFIYSSKIPANTKSISIKAFNRGLCPAGHPGEGKPAWIFTDEVIGY